ncbi:hypothetical protein STAS_18051 [Striga asiatica]|uniref:Uncharacterized protein n=1 Tax=Striga asiatica TaxID=4170 RepID=A0A5A7QA84_STRAF|nr:hypothetical protein STAS_18051 [Striga asiatica]
MDASQRRSPASTSSSSSTAGNQCRRFRRGDVVEENSGDPAVACTGKSFQSCTAGVIADCVAVCCCPCAVVNILALAFVKLPWAVARRCIGGGRRRRRRRRLKEEQKWCEEGRDAISGDGRAGVETTSDRVLSGVVIGEGLNDRFSAKGEDVWLELYDEVGHLGFGRVSFTGIPFQDRGN